MSHLAPASIARQLEALFEDGCLAGLTDRQLLERFIACGRTPAGEAAFAALVARHGPMVLDVCRQLLGDAQHAEDSFQAVFLVLAQRARSIRDPDSVGNWLYGVAIRTARCARQQIARRRRREKGEAMSGRGPGSCEWVETTDVPPVCAVIDREQAEAIHGEIARLPRTFRLPVVLCYFEGLTLDEAARRLRCPPGTVGSRLARAREKLKINLSRRGVALPASALGAVLVPRSTSASLPPLLCDRTTRAAIRFAAQHATGGALCAPAVALAQEVLRTMLWHKLKMTMTALLLMTAVATGAGWLARSLAVTQDPEAAKLAPRTADPAKPLTKPDRATGSKPDPATPGRMTVTGRVVDPAGKPVAGVSVDIIGRPRKPWILSRAHLDYHTLLGAGTTDGDGTSASMPFEPRRITFSRFTRWLLRPGLVWAGWCSIPTPGSLSPRLVSGRNSSFTAGSLTLMVSTPQGSSSGSAGSGNRPAQRESMTASTWVISRRRKAFAPGRGPSLPMRKGDSRFPVSVATSSWDWKSAMFASPSSGSRFRPMIDPVPRRPHWPSIRRRSSRAACSRPTPGSLFRTRPWRSPPARQNWD